jgi:CoA:oxalate CoA-transferase
LSPPLAGIRVLALENYLAGNHGTFLLSMLGAEIIKVEPPGGDVLRGVGPFIEANGGRRSSGELRVMGNKRSVTLDIRTPEGLAVLMKLVAQSDVVWTNQKPASLERLGITFESLAGVNPRIVYATLSGFGHDDLLAAGPLGSLPAFDVIAQGLAGLQFRASGADGMPGYNGLALGDEVTSLLTVLGTVCALYRQQTSDPGPQRVDVAMHDSMVYLNELTLGLLSVMGVMPPRGRSGTSAPYGAFQASDGWVNIAVGGDPVWRRFCAAIDREDLAADERFASSFGRVQHAVELNGTVSEWTASRTMLDITGALSRHAVPCAPILDAPDVLASDQVAARHMLVDIDDPIAGPVKVVGNPVKMNGLDTSSAEPPHAAGQDTEQILRSVAGLTEAELTQLRDKGILGTSGQGNGGA